MRNKTSFKNDLVALLTKYKIGEYCRQPDSKLAKEILDLVDSIAKIPMKWDNLDN